MSARHDLKFKSVATNFKITKPKKKRNFKILNSAGLYKFIEFEIAKFLQSIFKF
jgi:hypothetical protein